MVKHNLAKIRLTFDSKMARLKKINTKEILEATDFLLNKEIQIHSLIERLSLTAQLTDLELAQEEYSAVGDILLMAMIILGDTKPGGMKYDADLIILQEHLNIEFDWVKYTFKNLENRIKKIRLIF
jgi:hypothetical protein